MSKNDKNDLGYLGEDFQYKLIHFFMEDKEFFKDLSAIVDQNMFTNPTLKMFVGVMKEYYEKEEAVPSYSVMGIALNDKAHNDIERELYNSTLEKISEISSEGASYIRQLAIRFFKQQNIVKTANTILKIAGDGDTSKYDKCVELLSNALNQGDKEEEGNTVFDDIGETLSDDYRIPIPTGIGKIDETLEGGLGKGELGVIIGSSSFGKAQPLTSKILTPNGWKLMRDMKIDDEVIGRDGKYHKVSGVFPQGIRPIYKVTLSNGATCECDIEHLWAVKDYSEKEQVLTLKDIIKNGLLDNNNNFKFQVPNMEAISFNEQYVDFEPYEYGKKISVDDVIDEKYLYNTKEIREKLLRGLSEYDNLINNSNLSSIIVINKKLSEQIKWIIESLGGYASITHENGKYIIKYNILEKNPLYIASAEYVRDDYAQCIMVDSDEHLYITDNFIVTHNTSLTTAMCSHASTYKCENNNFQGYKVLQIVFEDRIKQIQRKHIGRITGIEAKDLSKPQNIDNVKQILNQYENKDMMAKNLRIMRLPSGEITATKIERMIKKMINNGFKPDMLVVDYFECLNHIGDESTTNEWEKEGKTMRKFESMAGKLDMAIWIPTQGTKDSVNLELVTMDKAGGSFKKIQIAHIVMSIARTMEDIEANKATIAILKNRAGKSGKVFNNVEFNNGTCRISTDNVDEFDNMIEYNKNSQKEKIDLATKIFKLSQEKNKK